MERKRKYTKRDPKYWSSLGKKQIIESRTSEDYKPSFEGTPFYVSSAETYSRTSGVVRNTKEKINYGPRYVATDGYSNLDSYSAPFNYDRDGVATVKEPILLCQKAYYHVPIFRNTVDMMAELSDADLVLTGGTKGSRAFIKKWLESAKIEAVKEQFFREYYRSGNVFLYRLFAKFEAAEIATLKTIYAKEVDLLKQDSGFPEDCIPLKYIVLNPYDMVNSNSVGSSPLYKKALSKFDVTRLQNPTTEEDKRLVQELEKNKKNALLKTSQEIYIDLDPARLLFAFYKKQDYEPFAVPFAFPVLRDINWKLELKKIDQSVSRSLENIVLLITMGAEPDKGGINPRHLEAMKDLFSNEAVGRVLIADYTTKAQFIIPQIENILGASKYEIVNQDIKEGLQNIFFEEAKYADSEIKIKLFFERLKEGKKVFLREFLQPEIKKVCSEFGFRDYPKVRFKSSTVMTESDIQKAALRLIELGILPPKQGVESMNNKELPDAVEIGEGQDEYRKQRESGQYVPLVGGPPLYPEQEVAPSTAPKAGAPVKVPSKSRGRPSSNSVAEEDMISAKGVAEVGRMATKFEEFAVAHIKKTRKLKTIDAEQKDAIYSLCRSIVESNEIKDWEDVFVSCSKAEENIDRLNIKPEILEIASGYEIPTYEAAMVYHSKTLKI